MSCYKLFISACSVIIAFSLNSCNNQEVSTNEIVHSCAIHYYRDEVPWVPDWLGRGTVEFMLEEEPLIIYDSLAINQVKGIVDSLYLTSSIDVYQADEGVDPTDHCIDVRYLMIFDYGLRKDTLLLASTPSEGMIMKKRLFYSEDVYFRMVNLIKRNDKEWGRIFDKFCRDGVFLYGIEDCFFRPGAKTATSPR